MEKSGFFILFVHNLNRKKSRNLNFRSPKSRNFGLIKATRNFFMSGVRGSTKYTKISWF